MQALADVHDTPFRRLVVAPLGLGVGWITQPVLALAGMVPHTPTPPKVINKILRRLNMFRLAERWSYLRWVPHNALPPSGPKVTS